MEYKAPLMCAFYRISTLVDQSVVMAAEEYQILQGSMAVLRPKLHVVAVAEAVIRVATWKSTALIP